MEFMVPEVVRAFLNLQLSPKQRASLRAFERSGKLPGGRCLTACEICRMFQIQSKVVPDCDIETMRDLWQRYQAKILWKNRKIEEKDHETKCQEKCQCKSRVQEIHDWEDWALVHFGNVEIAA